MPYHKFQFFYCRLNECKPHIDIWIGKIVMLLHMYSHDRSKQDEVGRYMDENQSYK